MRRETLSDKIFDIVNHTLVILAVILVLYPLLYILSSSFSSTTAVQAGRVRLWPVEFSLLGYQTLLHYRLLWSSVLNSLFYVVAGTSISVSLTLMLAYACSRKDFKPRGILMFLLGFLMIFPPGMIPRYLQVSQLGMMNTRWALLLPSALSALNVIITRTFFQSNIPDELLEAAQLDGASDFQFFFRIAIPICAAVIAINMLFYGVAQWNQYFDAMLFLTSEKLYPLQLILRKVLVLNSIGNDVALSDIKAYASKAALGELLKYSLVVVSVVPMMLVYPFIQKYLVKGMLIGSLKG